MTHEDAAKIIDLLSGIFVFSFIAMVGTWLHK